MATPFLPDLPGIGWKMTRKLTQDSLIQTAASGLEARATLQILTKREWDLVYNYLRTGVSFFGEPLPTFHQEVQILEGFWLAQSGQLLTFFYRDQQQNTALGQLIATGDGVTAIYQLVRTIQGYTEPVFCIDTRGVSAYGPYTRPASITPVVYVNSIAIPTVINTAPASGGAAITTESGVLTLGASAISAAFNLNITADFTYCFRVRFTDASVEFENIFGNLNTMRSLKFIQTRV